MSLAPAVGYLDPESARCALRTSSQCHREQEIPPSHVAVSDGVRSELGNDVCGSRHRVAVPAPPPSRQLLDREQAGKTRPAPCRAELLVEVRWVRCKERHKRTATDFVFHVTESVRLVVR